MSKIALISSNDNKLKEFRRFGLMDLDIKKGVDLKEVEADSITVIKYKSMEAGPGTIVEDTSLHVDGESVGSNIRWFIENLNQFNGKKAEWEVMVALNDGENIKIYQGLITGKIIANMAVDHSKSFGFDPYFIPDGCDTTLAVLDMDGKKDLYSARKASVDNLLVDNPLEQVSIEDIPVWTGKYQHEELTI